MTKPTKKRVNLALQGGGAHGAFTWGVLDAFLADGRLDVAAISGASAGAMNAVVFADGLREGGPEGCAQAAGAILARRFARRRDERASAQRVRRRFWVSGTR